MSLKGVEQRAEQRRLVVDGSLFCFASVLHLSSPLCKVLKACVLVSLGSINRVFCVPKSCLKYWVQFVVFAVEQWL